MALHYDIKSIETGMNYEYGVADCLHSENIPKINSQTKQGDLKLTQVNLFVTAAWAYKGFS